MAEDFSKPGNDGGTVPESYDKAHPPISVAYGVDLDATTLPTPLECGKRYELLARTQREVTKVEDRGSACWHVYDELLTMLRDRADQLKCEDSCQPMHTWVAERGWRWSADQAKSSVTVIVALGVICPRTQDAKPAGLASPAGGAFDEPQDNLEPPDRESDGTLASDEKAREYWFAEGQGPFARCGSDRLVRFRLETVVPTCRELDFSGYVSAARSLAQFYVGTIKCRDAQIAVEGKTRRVDCERRARRLLTEWSCEALRDAGICRVYVYWEVRCVIPRL